MIRRGLAAGWVLLGLVMNSPVHAALEWGETRIQLAPPAGAQEASAVFTVVNRGASPVRITEVRSGCGCAVPELERTELEPGGKGTLRAVFHIGQRRGRQTVEVSVFTDEARSEPYTLKLDVEISPSVEITPRLVYWKLGDEPSPKTVNVALVEDFSILGVDSGSADFAVELLPGEGAVRQVRIAPRDTMARRQVQITVRIARGASEAEAVPVWARVL